MPMFKATSLPDAVIIKPDMEKYGRVGREVRDLMRELTPLVEPLSIDEAFMDLRGTGGCMAAHRPSAHKTDQSHRKRDWHYCFHRPQPQ